MSKRKAFLSGVAVGFLICAVLLAALAGVTWKNRFRVAGKIATAQIAILAEHFFRALPEGYVTKNRETVMDVLDEFTNSVGSENVTKAELQAISRAIVAGLEDGKLRYRELDYILELMHTAATTY